ncbi:MAG: tetratricopeptide repeat protein [Bryobacterales bacterium]|nr:tetratricopeptide repeat protein [Bryobacterales bacterium]
MWFAAALLWAMQPDPAALVPLYEQALAQRERELGPHHVKLARIARDFALFHLKHGRQAAAIPLLRKALAIDERHYGPANRIAAEDMEHLAALLAGDEALALRARAAQCDDAAVAARNLAALAEWELSRRNPAAALARYREALAKEQQASGDAHPRYAVRLNDVALLLDPPAAEPLLRRALAIQESALGPQHPEVAVTLNNLANILLALGRLPDALPLARRALSALEHSLGAVHPRVATAASNLADILAAAKDYSAARALYERALRIDEKALGPNHPEIAVDLENLAALHDTIGNKAQAAKLRARAASLKPAN